MLWPVVIGCLTGCTEVSLHAGGLADSSCSFAGQCCHHQDVGRPLSPSLLQVTKPVYASTTKRNLDGLGSNTQREEAPALSFPDICFAVEDSEAVFDTLVSRLCCMSSACLQGSA